MKKKLLIASLAVVGASAASANDKVSTDGNFYMGGDIGYKKQRYKDNNLDNSAKEMMPTMNIYGGYNLSENLAVEGGVYSTSEKGRVVNGDKTKVQEYGMYVDAVKKHQITDNTNLLGTAGLQYGKLKDSSNNHKNSDEDWAPRIGAGAEYKLTDNTKIRGMARYAHTDYDDAVKRSVDYTVGLNYRF